MSIHLSPSYMQKAFDHKQVARDLRSDLRDTRYDTLVGVGVSGAIAVPILAYKLRKHFLIVRKPNVNSHDSQQLVGDLGERWLFVDDLVDTGKTLARACEVINEYSDIWRAPAEFVGAYLYGGRGFIPPTDKYLRDILRY